MLNTPSFRFIKISCFLIITSISFSCKNEALINFTETSIIDDDEVIIEINIPKAKGQTKAAEQINATLSQFINRALNIESPSKIKNDTKESINGFKKTYKKFKTQIGKTLFTNLPPWEVFVDGEIIYKTPTLTSIAMSSTINTGGAHANTVFQFYNFNLENGNQLTTKDLINDIPAFTKLAEKYYKKELLSANKDRIEAFKSNNYKLPEHLGFNNDGVIIFYDTINYSNNYVIEFTIPYAAINQYLSF